MAITSSEKDRQFSELVSRIFSDERFASSLESNPQKALTEAGLSLDDEQIKALNRPTAAVSNLSAAVDAVVDPGRAAAAIVRPVVSVLTKGTRPVVNVVVSSAVVAAKTQGEERN
jgi:hypothetical protein